MTGAAVWLVAFALFLGAHCPTLTHWDAAELLVVGRGLDIGHPPGYPLLACLVRLALLLPVGGTMVRASLVPIGAAAAAVALVPAVAQRLGASRGVSVIAAGIALACPFLWEQATTLEKHPLHLALAMGAAATALGPGARWLPAAFALGVALSHHPLTLMLTPLLGPAAWRRWRRPGGRSRAALLALLLVLVPLSVRPMYAAIRAAALARSDPAAANWGEPARCRTLLAYLTVREYSAVLGRAGRQ